MKAVNLALVALAGLGLVSSQVALADTLPAAAVPTAPAAGKIHPIKLVRFSEKRRSDDSSAITAVGGLFIVLGAGAVGAGGYEAFKKGSNGG